MSERACACVHDDPYWCMALRYGDPMPDNPDDDEMCECICHDEWHQAQEDDEAYWDEVEYSHSGTR